MQDYQCPYCSRRKRRYLVRCEACQKIHLQISRAQTDKSAAELESKRMAMEMAKIRRANATEMRAAAGPSQAPVRLVREISIRHKKGGE